MEYKYQETLKDTLLSLNVPQEKEGNIKRLQEIGGVNYLLEILDLDVQEGLNDNQVVQYREFYGNNHLPDSPYPNFLSILLDILSDTMILVLIGAATISLIVGLSLEGPKGWIEGVAIYSAVIIVSLISAYNEYSYKVQFFNLEKISTESDVATIKRNGFISQIHPSELVVGDIILLEVGNSIPADCILITKLPLKCDESSLTGEGNEVEKSILSDSFLLSSSTILEGVHAQAFVIAVGVNSQWGRIKSNISIESNNTPLQDKLTKVAKLFSFFGISASVLIYIAIMGTLLLEGASKEKLLIEAIRAFIFSVAIIVVAIPEGLPIAVTISLAYTCHKMFKDNCLIRTLSSCETMGNINVICTDKTGTLTENKMVVTECWISNNYISMIEYHHLISEASKSQLAINISTNRSAISLNNSLDFFGNKTEIALLNMIISWGYDPDACRDQFFNQETDTFIPFNSSSKISYSIIQTPNNTKMVYLKGGIEIVLARCSYYLDQHGSSNWMNDMQREELERTVEDMAKRSLRVVAIACKEVSLLPKDTFDLGFDFCLQGIFGIKDPLRPDVIHSIEIAQKAGIEIKLMTGDNISTALAVAQECGIIKPKSPFNKDIVLDGSQFRQLTPSQLDRYLSNLKVIARCSPQDKLLLVSRLNGFGIPKDKDSWIKYFEKQGIRANWETDKDKVLPGYYEEWSLNRNGGSIVAVTGDGTNDAPALKAADVGLSLGISGTKVAQSASDIVLLDDSFTSIVNSVLWGRSVYDNIRRFLQFQFSINLSALVIVFITSILGKDSPINTIQMLWLNAITDSLGALALGTEPPCESSMNRKPYLRDAPLITAPIWRNIIIQSSFQIILILPIYLCKTIYLNIFSLPSDLNCNTYSMQDISNTEQYLWELKSNDQTAIITCADFIEYCDQDHNAECLYDTHYSFYSNIPFQFIELTEFQSNCLYCQEKSRLLPTIIFNIFIFCQIFNLISSRNLFNEWNIFKNIHKNKIFFFIFGLMILGQVLLVECGGDLVLTESLSWINWLICISLASTTLLIGILMRLIPIQESDTIFSTSSIALSKHSLENFTIAI